MTNILFNLTLVYFHIKIYLKIGQSFVIFASFEYERIIGNYLEKDILSLANMRSSSQPNNHFVK
jgi:hypothetical protein